MTTTSTAAQFKAEQAALRKEYLDRRLRRENDPDFWFSYYDKQAGHFARLSSGDIVAINKPRIETRFCFGESGYDYDDAQEAAHIARTSEEYFKQENLAGLQRWIDRLDGSSTDPVDVVVLRNGEGLASVTWCHHSRRIEEGWEEISEADRAVLLAAYRAAYAAFEKRLDAYLKRYGLSKVHAWTYWRDA